MEIWKFSDTYYIDPAARRAYVLDADGNCKQDFDISANCFDFLQALVENRGQVLEYETLGRRAYGEDMYYKKDNLTTNLRQLKKSLGTKYGCPDVIKAVPKVGYRLDYLEKVAAIPAVPPREEGDPAPQAAPTPAAQTEPQGPAGDPAPQGEPTPSVTIKKITPQILCDLLYGSADQRRALLGRAPVPKLRAYPVRDFLAAYLPDLQHLEWNQLDPQARKAVMQGDIWWGRRVLRRQILNNGHFTTEELVKTCRRQLQADVELNGLGQELTELLHAAVHGNPAYEAAERAFFLCDVNTYPERGLAILLLTALMGPGAFADLYSGQSAVAHFMV